MELNLSKDSVWYEDYLVGMVEIRAHKKKNDTIEIKEELTINMDNQSIGFAKALQKFQ